MKRFCLIGVFLCVAVVASSQEVRDTLQLYYKTSLSRIDTLFMRNGESFASFYDRNFTRFNDSTFSLRKVTVVGSASPEGRLAYNETLAMQRAQALADYLKKRLPLDEQLLEVTSAGVDWKTLTELVAEAKDMPYQQDALNVLQKGYLHHERLRRLKQVRGGAPYAWIRRNLFPLLRYSRALVYYDVKEVPQPPVVEEEELPVEVVEVDTVVANEEVPVVIELLEERKPLYWALKTNALYDALLVPNVGVELSIGKQWSVATNWVYAWWSNDHKDRFWRIYGGDVEARRWFGKKADEKPLQGHHVGVYGQLFTYDFTLRNRGYMADKWNYALGVSYGYSFPVAKRLNVDFTIGLGYWGGKYHDYRSVDDCKVWQATQNRHWWGPTKAEVSLVWLLGAFNDSKKGGDQ